jgi:hypothetical protein
MIGRALREGVLCPDVPWLMLSVIVTVGLVPTLLWRVWVAGSVSKKTDRVPQPD